MSGRKSGKAPPSRPGLGESPKAFRTTFADRLTMLLGLFESRAQAGDVAGVIADQLAKYVRGGAKPAFDVMARLCTAKGVSLDWLATGEGAMRVDEIESNMVPIPRYEVRAGAGSNPFASDEEPVALMNFHRDLLRAEGIKPENAMLMEADGDSMFPTIRDRELMLVDRGEREVRDAIYVFRVDDRLVVKRLQRQLDGSVLVISDNAKYQRETLPRADADELVVIGRVKRVFRAA